MTNEKEYYGFIYLTTNNIDNKKYIGQKKYDSQGRWKDYLGSGIRLKRAVNKYGSENFKREIIENCKTKEELDQREIYWIKYYNAVNDENFYNIASGGDGGDTIKGFSKEEAIKIIEKRSSSLRERAANGQCCYTTKITEDKAKKIIELLLKGHLTSEIANKLNISTSIVDDIKIHKSWKHLTKDVVFPKKSSSDYYNSDYYKKSKAKDIYQYDMDWGFIRKFSSSQQAEELTGIPKELIVACCNGNKSSAYGFRWTYKDINLKTGKKRMKKKKTS